MSRISEAPEPPLKLVSWLCREGRFSEAAGLCETYLECNPASAHMRSMLGICFAEQRRYHEAIASFREAVALQPGSARYRRHLAHTLRLSGAKEEAVETLKSALNLEPASAELYVAMGETLAELGRFDEALDAFENALRLRPTESWAYLGITLTKTITTKDAELVSQMQNLVKEQGLPGGDRMTLHYALGKALDDLGGYGDALRHVDEAVRISSVLAGPKRPRPRSADIVIGTFTRAFFDDRSSLGTDSQVPVFIVGAPRSGTTLLDQILTSHPQIGRAGELLFWLDHYSEADHVAMTGDPRAKGLAGRYVAVLREKSPDTLLVTDKMPMNYLCLGVIHALLPRARIIHCRRHPVDTCLSIYLNGHSISPKPYGETREEIVDGYKGYLQVMEHWRMTLAPDVLVEVDYEELVRDREPVLRRLLEFLQVGWSDACLEHESNSSQVSTPSRWQVRQPLYETSLERWRRYEPWLGPFAELSALSSS